MTSQQIHPMLNEHRIGGLLLMGGQGLRFGSDIPKQFHRLSGKPVYRVTLEAFLSAGFFDRPRRDCARHRGGPSGCEE